VLRAWATALVLAAAAPFVPNDPGFELNRTSLEAMRVPQAWALTHGDPAVVIAVIDTGVAQDPDLALMRGDTTDSDGHGTAMAAIAAARIDNGIGTAGICGNCRILPIALEPSTRAVSAAVTLAVDRGADLIAVTGTGTYTGAFDAVTNAINHGVQVFLPAGNDSSDDSNANRLASSNPRAVRVGSFELDANHGNWIDVAAETSFTTLGPAPTTTRGTRSATAAVAGIAGLLLSCNPSLLPGEIKFILMSTSVLRGVDVVANGEVDAYAAVKRAGCRASAPSIVRLVVSTRGSGTVTRRPDDDTYIAGARVVLRAKAKPKWHFARWNGLCRGQRAVCTVRLTESGMTTAVFTRAPQG
jgi:subtilisin family serine protease